RNPLLEYFFYLLKAEIPMTLDLTTFVLQIINFLVLLWLLHRFVYAPLRAAIGRRQEAQLAAEKAFQEKLLALEADRNALTAQQAQIEKNKQLAEARLAEEILNVRRSRMAALEKELSQAKEQGFSRIDTQLAERASQLQQQMQQQADEVIRLHLLRLASPAFEAVLLERFLADIRQLDDTMKSELRALNWQDKAEISSAFPLDSQQQSQLLAALANLRGEAVQADWKQDEKLIAGLRVGLDGKELELSLSQGLALLPGKLLAREAVAALPADAERPDETPERTSESQADEEQP
ncbi:MAG: F0F1 ATP synthase subunit delta, partial [Pseudomonadales bacterium]|nr:F0F1 ATP synthase subunit delta [Pseudomonadales bacterium]